MRAVAMNIKNTRSLRDVSIPLYRELTQVYCPDKSEYWDLTMCFNAIPLAIRNDWKSMSNVLTERMNEASRIEMVIRDEDEYNLIDNYPVPTHYTIVMSKIGPHYSTDIGLDYFKSVTGDVDGVAEWGEFDPGREMKRKFKDVCDGLIMYPNEALPFVKGLNTDDIVLDPFLDDDYYEDLGRLLPWYCLSNDETNGRTIFMHDIYYGVSDDGIRNFQTYLRYHKEGKFITSITDKKEYLDMSCRTTVIHKGKSHEYPYECHENDMKRKEAYERYLNDILQL